MFKPKKYNIKNILIIFIYKKKLKNKKNYIFFYNHVKYIIVWLKQ